MTDMGTFRTTVAIENVAHRGDMVLLGAHSLEGLNLRVDPVRKIPVDAGPIVAAAA